MEGRIAYLYTFPRKVADGKGNVTHTVETVQRVGLVVDGEFVHITGPDAWNIQLPTLLIRYIDKG